MSKQPSLPATTHGALWNRLLSGYKRNGLVVLVIITFSQGLGMVGYHLLAPMPWVDAFVNAAMLLGGMGPVDPLNNDGVKLFAGAYALYCGVVFIATAGLLIGPLARHLLHKFHLEQKS
ncbi:MAG: hypothetical protein ACRD2A_09075 [Vicinamibacterales bacterium]